MPRVKSNPKMKTDQASIKPKKSSTKIKPIDKILKLKPKTLNPKTFKLSTKQK